MNGLIIKSTGSWYDVLSDDKRVIRCRMKGKFRISDIKTTNPVAVGDQVNIELEPEQG